MVVDTTAGQGTGIAGSEGPDVEAHAMFSDERLKEEIRQLERSLASLKELEAVRADDSDDSDVEAHAMWSDERLKETIRQLERSLASLKQLQVEKDRRR